MADYSEHDERAAKIENLKADSEYKMTLNKVEPWKLLFGGLVAGAALMGGAVALMTLLLSHLGIH